MHNLCINEQVTKLQINFGFPLGNFMALRRIARKLQQINSPPCFHIARSQDLMKDSKADYQFAPFDHGLLAQQPLNPTQLAQLVAALQWVMPAIQGQPEELVIQAAHLADTLNEELRVTRIEKVTPLDVTDKGGTYCPWVLGIERNFYGKHRLLEIIKAYRAGDPDDAAITDWQIRNNATVSILLFALTTALCERIPPTYTALEIWERECNGLHS